MRNLLLACLAGVSLLSVACRTHTAPAGADPADSTAQQDSGSKIYFPVADVLESEIRTADSLPMAKKEYVIHGGRTDSGYLQPAEFHALAMRFLAPELRDGSFEKDFTENSFIDNTTQEATFTYSTNDPNLPLRRVDVVTAPEGAVHRMKSIYLERKRVSGDSTIFDKMYWRAGIGFEVISLAGRKGGTPAEQRLKVEWGGDNE